MRTPAIRHIIPAIVLMAYVTVLAQARPDFSGRWVLEDAARPLSSGAPAGRPDQGTLPLGDMGSGWGSPLTIAQDARQMRVDQTFFSSYDAATQPQFTYALDGSESSNAVMISHTTQVRLSRAIWDGSSLVITTRYPVTEPGSTKSVTAQATYRLTLASPTTMIIEATRAGLFGGNETTTKSIYRKG